MLEDGKRERSKPRTRGRREVGSSDMIEESEEVNLHPDRLDRVGEGKVKVLPLPLHLPPLSPSLVLALTTSTH
jgi:hypothetical protein